MIKFGNEPMTFISRQVLVKYCYFYKKKFANISYPLSFALAKDNCD